MLSWDEYVAQFVTLTDQQKVEHAIHFAKQEISNSHPLRDETDLIALGAKKQDPLRKFYRDFPYDYNLRGTWFHQTSTGMWIVHATPQFLLRNGVRILLRFFMQIPFA
jgi:hypothetical protein